MPQATHACYIVQIHKVLYPAISFVGVCRTLYKRRVCRVEKIRLVDAVVDCFVVKRLQRECCSQRMSSKIDYDIFRGGCKNTQVLTFVEVWPSSARRASWSISPASCVPRTAIRRWLSGESHTLQYSVSYAAWRRQ